METTSPEVGITRRRFLQCGSAALSILSLLKLSNQVTQCEQRRLEFSWQAFNAFNWVRCDVRAAQPSLFYDASEFGKYLSTLTTPRFMQFGFTLCVLSGNRRLVEERTAALERLCRCSGRLSIYAGWRKTWRMRSFRFNGRERKIHTMSRQRRVSTPACQNSNRNRN